MLSTEFEIHVQRERRWTVEAIRSDERSAIEDANALLGDSAVEAVRVIRIKRGWTGREYPTEIFAAAAEQRATMVTIPGPIERAPPCDTVADLHTLDARLTAGRLFRRYLDKHGLTPIELLHSHRELKRLSDAGMLVAGAIGRVASLQAVPTGQVGPDARERSRALNGLLDQVLTRARDVEARRLPRLGPDGLTPLIGRLRGADTDPGFAIGVVLTHELVTIRSLPAKLDWLMALAEADAEAEPAMVLDGFIADLLASGEMVQDLLGPQPHLGAALQALLRLQQGRFEPAGCGVSDLTVRLNRLFATGRLIEGSAVLIDRVRREPQGTTPLLPGGMREQAELFAELLLALTTPFGVLGGPPMAAAAVARQARLSNQGGAAATRVAIAGLGAHFASVRDELQFFLSLAGSDMAASFAEPIAEQLIQVLDHLRRVDVLRRQIPSTPERLKLLMQARNRLRETRLPDTVRDSLVRRLGTVIALHAAAESEYTGAATAVARSTE